jgi:hypothetical protein
MKINGMPVMGLMFAFDGCHKIYVCESDEEAQQARDMGYELHPIKELERVFSSSCNLRFISNLKLDKHYVRQFQRARFATL